MNILFLGTSDFAVPVLEVLLDSEHRVGLVVTAPDRPKGRGRKLESSPIARRARAGELPLFQPVRINSEESVARLRAVQPDLTVVVAYGQILRAPILELAPRGIVNLHGSLLPALRGAAPIARAIQQGVTHTGVSLQFVVREVDAGDVIDVEPMSLSSTEDAGEAAARMAGLAAQLLLRNLPALELGTADRRAQDPRGVTFAPPLRKEEGRIPWAASAREIVNHVRAMTPWPAAYTDLARAEGQRERIIVRVVEPGDDVRGSECPGTVIRADEELEVAAGQGRVKIVRLLRSGRSEMDAKAFLRGFPMHPGVILE